MYLAVDSKGKEWSFSYNPYRVWVDRNDKSKGGVWKPYNRSKGKWYQLDDGTIERWVGKRLTWDDYPVKITQKEIDSKNVLRLPSGLINMLKEQTEDLRVLFIEKSRVYAENEFTNAEKIVGKTIKEWCERYGIEPETSPCDGRLTIPIDFCGTQQNRERIKLIERARAIVSHGKEKYITKILKAAESHYQNSLLKLVDRLQRKGLTDTNFKIVKKSFDINFELTLVHEVDGEKTWTRCWTIIAEGEVQKPHYRFLVK